MRAIRAVPLSQWTWPELIRLEALLYREWHMKGRPDDDHMARGWIARRDQLHAEVDRRGQQLSFWSRELQ